MNHLLNPVANPLPKPETISIDKDKEIREIIQYHLSQHTLDFHSMTNFFEEKIVDKQLDYAKICGYYLINVIISTKSLKPNEKNELIGSVCRDIINLDNEINLENVKC